MRPCALCGSERASPLLPDPAGEPLYFACDDCGLARIARPDVEAPYDDAYYRRGVGGGLLSRLMGLLSLGAADFRDLGLGRGAGERVLDIGCGAGALVHRLDRAGFAACGIDTSGAATEIAHRRVPAADIACGRIEAAPWPSGRFDAAVSTHVLEHLDDPLPFLRAAARLLRPGGRIVLRVPDFGSLEARIAGRRWFHLDHPFHRLQWTRRSLELALRTAGFRDVRVRPARWEYKQTLLYSIAAAAGLDASPRLRLALLPLQVFFMPLAVLLSFLGAGGTLQAEGFTPAQPTGDAA